MADANSVSKSLGTLGSAGWNIIPLQANSNPSTLAKRHYLSKLWGGGYASKTMGAADHTTHVQTVLETPAVAVRIGIINCLATAVTGVKASVGVSDTLGASNSSTTTTMQSTTNCTFTKNVPITFTATVSAATSATLATNWGGSTGTYEVTFSDGSMRQVTLTNAATTATWSGAVSAGVQANAKVTSTSVTLDPAFAASSVDNPSITWSDWMNCLHKDRADGGTLTVQHVRIEIPYSAGANPNFPAFNEFTSTAGWEAEGSISGNVQPYERPWRGRTQATLGVTTPGNFTSTTTDEAHVPFIIQYIPRDQVEGATFAMIGDSTSEGTGATLRRCGYHARVQRDLSTQKRPIEFVNMAIHGAPASRFNYRALNMLTQVMPDACLHQIYTTNSFGVPATITFTGALTAATSGTLTAGFGGTTGTYTLVFSDGSTRLATLTNSSTSVSWAGAVTATANAFYSTVVADFTSIRGNVALSKAAYAQTDILPIWLTGLPTNTAAKAYGVTDVFRRNYNAEIIAAMKSTKALVADVCTAVSGGVDSTGQEQFAAGMAYSDNTHPSDAGYEAMAATVRGVIRGLLSVSA